MVFTMHDLVHDLARSVMGDELHDASKEFKQFEGSNCRYAFLADINKPLNSYVSYPDKITALHFLGSSETRHCSTTGFSAAKYLRVLDLGESSLDKLPSSVGQLKLLRYLNAPGIKDQVIPSSITKLSNLIYLNLCGCFNISALPESIGELEALLYLDLSGCMEIRKLPESFGKLKSLVHLNLSSCGANGIPGVLHNHTKLQHLNLSYCKVAEQGLLEVIDKLIELRYLCLSGCFSYVPSVTVFDILDRISTLPNLEHLNLAHNYSIEAISDSIQNLRKLDTLDLSHCMSLKKLPRNMADMNNLKLLIVDECNDLDMSTLPINKSLIPLPTFMVHAIEGEQSSNLILLKDVNPRAP